MTKGPFTIYLALISPINGVILKAISAPDGYSYHPFADTITNEHEL